MSDNNKEQDIDVIPEGALILDDLDNIPEVDKKTAVYVPGKGAGFLYPSGSIRDSKGLFLVHHQPGAARPFDRYNSRAAVKKREEIRRQAVQNAIIEGTASIDLAGGLEKLAAALVHVAIKGVQDRDKIAAFKELMRHGGLSYDLGRNSAAVSGVPGGSGLSNDAIRALNVILPAIESRLNDPNGGKNE